MAGSRIVLLLAKYDYIPPDETAYFETLQGKTVWFDPDAEHQSQEDVEYIQDSGRFMRFVSYQRRLWS